MAWKFSSRRFSSVRTAAVALAAALVVGGSSFAFGPTYTDPAQTDEDFVSIRDDPAFPRA